MRGLGADMFDSLQFVASGSPEFRVGEQHVYGELNFVDHALSWAMTARKQFEVFKLVVLAVAVFVMNCFLGKQLTAKVLFHHVAVFHDASRGIRSPSHYWHRHPNISVFLSVFFIKPVFKTVLGVFHLCVNFALVAAIFLLSVYATACFAVAMLFFAALRACKFVAFVSFFSASKIGTGHRTIKRIAVELFTICSQIRLHHRKGFAAFFAGEFDGNTSSSRNIFVKSAGAATSEAAKFSPSFDVAWIAVKRLLAFFTNGLDRHGLSPLFGNSGEISHVVLGCQVASTEEF